MAIIKIESFKPEDEKKIPELLENITEKIAERLDWSGKGLRVYFTEIPENCYAFGGEIGKELSKEAFPPMVHLYVQEKREKSAVDIMVKTVAEQVAKVFEISPENVYVMVNKYGKNEMFMYGKYI